MEASQASNDASPILRRKSLDSASYDADDLEKDDLVRISEPQKPQMRGNVDKQGQLDQSTSETAPTRGGNDNKSLMREISGRYNKDEGSSQANIMP